MVPVHALLSEFDQVSRISLLVAKPGSKVLADIVCSALGGE
jgi:hypothetical protein